LKKAYVMRTLKSFVKAGPSSSLKHGMLLSVRTTSFSAAYRQAHSHTCTHTRTHTHRMYTYTDDHLRHTRAYSYETDLPMRLRRLRYLEKKAA
jgi:hypothetical protein